jgi:prepilin-type N-terminal cleavage/methylation domain-containing protein
MRRAFTLIELIVVVAIISILLSMVVQGIQWLRSQRGTVNDNGTISMPNIPDYPTLPHKPAVKDSGKVER